MNYFFVNKNNCDNKSVCFLIGTFLGHRGVNKWSGVVFFGFGCHGGVSVFRVEL